jgi:riboflavin kinase/FMN adenylyltransferase
MEIFTSPAIPESFRHAVIAIGNFDGVHRGHAHVLEMVKAEARKTGKRSGVLTFEPHPRHLFRPDDPPFRITPAPLKHERLAEEGIDFCCSLPFDWDFASQSADAFIDTVLGKLSPFCIVIGEDFRFGQLRKGTPDTLREAGLRVMTADSVADADGAILSSSRIREALRLGDIGQANTLLGWDWMIEGVVVKGDQRGRELGYPTANVRLSETLHPAYGIYAALVQVEGHERWFPSATNIGIRPMFELKVGQVEAHILDFDRDIYGKVLRIRPVKKLRGEAKFDSLEALVAQIDEDCRQARIVLGEKS